jgi:hypothetical protein
LIPKIPATVKPIYNTNAPIVNTQAVTQKNRFDSDRVRNKNVNFECGVPQSQLTTSLIINGNAGKI